jgi:hypothetical protein
MIMKDILCQAALTFESNQDALAACNAITLSKGKCISIHAIDNDACSLVGDQFEVKVLEDFQADLDTPSKLLNFRIAPICNNALRLAMMMWAESSLKFAIGVTSQYSRNGHSSIHPVELTPLKNSRSNRFENKLSTNTCDDGNDAIDVAENFLKGLGYAK